MVELTLELVASIISIIIGVSVVIGICVRHERRHTKLETLVENLERQMKNFEEVAKSMEGLIWISKNPELIDIVKQIGSSGKKANPYDPEEKARLLDRYRGGTLSNLGEARRLQEMLREDASKSGGNIIATIAIIAILAGLAALIAYLISKGD